MKGKPKFNDAKDAMEDQWNHQPIANPIKMAKWDWDATWGITCKNRFDRDVPGR